jgi:2-C-methyl-D-erythritol 2,4-cyclodiphosphate synthase
MNAPFRIGHGVDVHRLVQGRKLIIGGVEIPFRLGLDGHSDADVLLHAVADAILGAIGERDIGSWFPNTDEKWRGVSSLVLLAEVWRVASERGWVLGNIDANVIAEAPKLSPYIVQMKERIAETLSIEVSQVGIKATTSEGLGYQGRAEGISADAVVLLYRSQAAEPDLKNLTK